MFLSDISKACDWNIGNQKGVSSQMKSRLDYRDGHLCVVQESALGTDRSRGPLSYLRKWYPVREAAEAEVAMLVGRPLNSVDPGEGLYADEEGNPYQLLERGKTRPLPVKKAPVAKESERAEKEADSGEADALALAGARAADGTSTGGITGGVEPKALLRKLKRKRHPSAGDRANGQPGHERLPEEPSSKSANGHLGGQGRARGIQGSRTVPLNLRQKLSEVRRRIGYIQKRGLNERLNYRYVTAADIAGAVGDILAQLGVVVVPSLESIAYEPVRVGGAQIERMARVVMTYTFTDAESGEAVMVKVPGEGLDVGDKAPYKAMTGALKYALLQSFLLATGDDPEEERLDSTNVPVPSREIRSERKATEEEVRQLSQLIEDTGTDLERMLAYYKLGSLEEMTEGVYRRAVDLLNRKKAKQSQAENAHAQD